MENEKMQINLAPGMEKATIKVIELDKENVLPVLEPLKVSLSGTIGSVAEFLKKRSSPYACEKSCKREYCDAQE